MFPCPHGDFTGKTGRAWKVHMSRKHGSYSEKQWLEVSRLASAPPDTEFSRAQPPPANEAESSLPPGQLAPELSASRQELVDRFAALKGKFAKGLAVLSFTPFKHYLKLEPLKEEDRKTLAEGWAAALDCLDIQPAWEPRRIELRSWLSAFLFPLLALAMVIAERFDYRALWNFIDKPEPKPQDQPDHRPDSSQGGGEDEPGYGHGV
jgi:hypothetical protein